MIDDLISQKLRKEHETERAAHTPSGKLSASQLHKPLLEQVLRIIGVPEKPVDDYALRLFKRGKQVEEWVCALLDGEEQVEVMYRDVVGFVDKVMDVPVEVKSVKSSQWKWLKKDGARWSHKLQAGLYALGLGKEVYKILYVTADDFRTFTYEGRVDKREVDRIIDEVHAQLRSGVLPEFRAREDWQNNPKYSNYPEWMSLDPVTMMDKLENQFKEAFNTLRSYNERSRET